MNVEEKAKAYDEAVKRAKAAIDVAADKDLVEGVVRTILPELAESDDERTRKSIIHILQVGGYMSPEEKDKAFAYLEKQKDLNNMIVVSPEVWDNAIADAYENGKKDAEKQEELPFVKDVVLGYPGHYFYDGERMHFCGPVMEEKQKEQKPAESRKRNKPKESWLSKAKYEIEHADELLIQRQEELREIRELKKKEQESESCEPDTNVENAIEDVIRVYGKTQGEWVGGYDVDALIVNLRRAFNKKEQHPSSKFRPNDWVVYDGPLGHAILQVEDVIDGRYTFVDNDSTLLVEDSDKFLRPLTPKDVEKPAEWSDTDNIG